MQIEHVVGVLVSHDDGVDAAGDSRAQMGEQARQRAVSEVEHEAESPVLQDEPAARPSGLRPRAAAP